MTFAGAVAQPDGPRPGTLPQIAFSGRSNVGKSSLINRFLGRTRTAIARVSSTPGKTQEINFYEVIAERALQGENRGELRGELPGADFRFYLVDLPGYGYARAPGALKALWRPLIESYLGGTPQLKGVVQLIDARHTPTPDDLQMVSFLESIGLPTLFVLTKVDKLKKKTERTKNIARAVETLGVDPDQVLPFSTVTGEGRDDLLESVESLLE